MSQNPNHQTNVNFVHQDDIYAENVCNEEKYLMKNKNWHYQVNPYNCNFIFDNGISDSCWYK